MVAILGKPFSLKICITYIFLLASSPSPHLYDVETETKNGAAKMS